MFLQLFFINIPHYVPRYRVWYTDRRTEYGLYEGYQIMWMSV